MAGPIIGSVVGAAVILGGIGFWIRRHQARSAASGAIAGDRGAEPYEKAQLHGDSMVPGPETHEAEAGLPQDLSAHENRVYELPSEPEHHRNGHEDRE